MKKTIGVIINSSRFGKEEKIFIKVAKKKKIELIFFNAAEKINYKDLIAKAKKCEVIYDDTSEDIALEIAKTIESSGKKVVDASKIYYYSEDKWMFYVKCKKSKIPVPETILLSDNLKSIPQELKEFKQWPVVLKKINGSRGDSVELAKNTNEAEIKIKKLWQKGNERSPIIAQEFIKSDSYRVTFIGNKIVQTAIKRSNGWKATGCYSERFGKFKIDPKLKEIIKKLIKITGIKVGGVDLLKKKDKWIVLEINSEPSFDFFNCENEKLVNDVFNNLLKKR